MLARYLFLVARGCGWQQAQASCCFAGWAPNCRSARSSCVGGCIPVQMHSGRAHKPHTALNSCAASVWPRRGAGAQAWRA